LARLAVIVAVIALAKSANARMTFFAVMVRSPLCASYMETCAGKIYSRPAFSRYGDEKSICFERRTLTCCFHDSSSTPNNCAKLAKPHRSRVPDSAVRFGLHGEALDFTLAGYSEP
jgi:hypothetical protein